MARTRQAQKLLQIMEEGGGKLTLPLSGDVEAKMKSEGMSPYRLATYIWNIKKAFGIEPQAIKQGKKVVAYVLPEAKQDGAPVETESTEPAAEMVAEVAVESKPEPALV